MKNFLRRYFQVEMDLRVISAVRILVAADMCWDWVIRWNLRDLIYLGKGLFLDQPWYQWKFSLFYVSDNPGYRIFLFAVILASYLSLLVGYRTRVAALASFIGFISLASFNSELSTAEDSLGQMALFWLMVLPSGAYFSLDRLLGRFGRPGAPLATRVLSPWAWSVAFQFAVIYLCTGINKHLIQPNGWPTGYAVWGFVLSPHVGWGIGQLFMHAPAFILRGLCQIIPAQQLVMGVLFLIPSRWTRLMAVLGGLSLHFGIGANMWTGDVWFIPICGLVLLIDPSFVDAALASFHSNRTRSPQATLTPMVSGGWIAACLMATLVYCQLIDIFDHNSKFGFHFPDGLRLPIVTDVERAVFRGQHWAMYTNDVAVLQREFYIAETNQGPIDVSSAFDYPWLLDTELKRPDLKLKYFLGNRAPLLHRRIRDSVHARLGRNGCDKYDDYFDIYKRRYEERFPGLEIRRIHIVMVQRPRPEVGDYAALSDRSAENWFRMNTWTPKGYPVPFDESLVSLLGNNDTINRSAASR